jgi:hypothetical protein
MRDKIMLVLAMILGAWLALFCRRLGAATVRFGDRIPAPQFLRRPAGNERKQVLTWQVLFAVSGSVFFVLGLLDVLDIFPAK